MLNICFLVIGPDSLYCGKPNLNSSKSAAVIIGTKYTTCLAQNLNVIPKVHHTKNSGIVIDENLSYSFGKLLKTKTSCQLKTEPCCPCSNW